MGFCGLFFICREIDWKSGFLNFDIFLKYADEFDFWEMI